MRHLNAVKVALVPDVNVQRYHCDVKTSHDAVRQITARVGYYPDSHPPPFFLVDWTIEALFTDVLSLDTLRLKTAMLKNGYPQPPGRRYYDRITSLSVCYTGANVPAKIIQANTVLARRLRTIYTRSPNR
jgi:hypothetical protein